MQVSWPWEAATYPFPEVGGRPPEERRMVTESYILEKPVDPEARATVEAEVVDARSPARRAKEDPAQGK